ncbi:hypothetical protein I4F81_005311 [Pyropia yezoensis]|uniref:Uncharacterized protein n=1 Tax=Pyropia yezoensis TaxID=2788 RepID=A0ACC3BXK0_PYRYE|nr:hypothetical protein I4F81_005311 [Neopyropia yezoensis]
MDCAWASSAAKLCAVVSRGVGLDVFIATDTRFLTSGLRVVSPSTPSLAAAALRRESAVSAGGGAETAEMRPAPNLTMTDPTATATATSAAVRTKERGSTSPRSGTATICGVWAAAVRRDRPAAAAAGRPTAAVAAAGLVHTKAEQLAERQGTADGTKAIVGEVGGATAEERG